MNFDQPSVGIQRERLIRQLKVVNKKTNTSILEKQPIYTSELENVWKLQKELQAAIKTIQSSRANIFEARHKFTASSLGILAAYRRRQRARLLLDNLVVISTFQRTDERLHQYLDEGDFPGAIKLLFEARDAAKTYSHFKAIQQLSTNLTETLELAEEQLDVALSKICVDFKADSYEKLQEAYALLGKTQTSMDQLQMHSASAVHNNAWNVVYGHVVLCQDDPELINETAKKLYVDLCCQLPGSSLLPCLVDLCRSLCNIMQSYQLIYDWHRLRSNDQNDFVLRKLANGFARIWQDVQTKIKVLISSNAQIKHLHIDTFLKIIDTIHLLIEVGHKFCSSNSDSLKQSLKDQCWTYFQNYHEQRLSELNMHLDNEGWQLCPVKSTFKISQLREFQLNSMSSPRKKDIQSCHHDFAAPFQNFLEESILEEDFLLQDDFESDEDDEQLNQASIDEESCHRRMTKSPFITSTSLMLLRLFGKYVHLLQMLEPISSQVFGCLTQLMDRYLMAVFKYFSQDLVRLFVDLQRNRKTEPRIYIYPASTKDQTLSSFVATFGFFFEEKKLK